MKKQIIIPLALALLCSCGDGKNSNNSKSNEESNTEDSKVSRKKLMITGDFNQITSLGGIDIVYTQGDFNIDIEGDSTLFSSVKADVESGILTLFFATDNNTDLNYYGNNRKLTAYISSPDLKCVALCSTGNFKSVNKWSIDDIYLGVIGTGGFELDSVECNHFKYEATGEGDASFKYIGSKENIMITCMNKSDVTAEVRTGFLDVATKAGKVTLTGYAKDKSISATSASLVEDDTTR